MALRILILSNLAIRIGPGAVPLCAIHHTENHATGDERRWWKERKIDPLPFAEQLWRHSNGIKQPTPARDKRAYNWGIARKSLEPRPRNLQM
jgi:hypothetical protein